MNSIAVIEATGPNAELPLTHMDPYILCTYTHSGGGPINDLTLSSTKERRPEGDVVGPTLLSNIG